MTNEKLGRDPLAALIQDTRKTKKAPPRPAPGRRTAQDRPGKVRAGGGQGSTTAGLPEGWVRGTFILRDEHLEKLRALSYFERRTVKELVDEAFTAFLRGKKVQTRGGK